MEQKMKNENIQEHKHRLARNLYKGKIIVSFTMCISKNTKLFITDKIFLSMEQILLECLKKESSEAHIYLLMPDHCHLLIEGKFEDSNLWKFAVSFKQKSGYWLSKNGYSEKWQKDFYDHILRKNEDVKKQILYTLKNPVRKGIVDDWKEYPFKGSTLYELNEW
ncbi:transposase [candidate division WOR-3 bacterium]|nr:transposase [candidate division WOR-3 bacterium]